MKNCVAVFLSFWVMVFTVPLGMFVLLTILLMTPPVESLCVLLLVICPNGGLMLIWEISLALTSFCPAAICFLNSWLAMTVWQSSI